MILIVMTMRRRCTFWDSCALDSMADGSDSHGVLSALDLDWTRHCVIQMLLRASERGGVFLASTVAASCRVVCSRRNREDTMSAADISKTVSALSHMALAKHAPCGTRG